MHVGVSIAKCGATSGKSEGKRSHAKKTPPPRGPSCGESLRNHVPMSPSSARTAILVPQPCPDARDPETRRLCPSALRTLCSWAFTLFSASFRSGCPASFKCSNRPPGARGWIGSAWSSRFDVGTRDAAGSVAGSGLALAQEQERTALPLALLAHSAATRSPLRRCHRISRGASRCHAPFLCDRQTSSYEPSARALTPRSGLGRACRRASGSSRRQGHDIAVILVAVVSCL
eukprot:scaffold71990_cov65-Phaeocystis_antarctica.AAC.2